MLKTEAVGVCINNSESAALSLSACYSFLPERAANYYEVLGLDRFASTKAVESAFLRKMRQLLSFYDQTNESISLSGRQELLGLYIARDVLKDPLTREEYDFRLLSLRRRSAKQTAPSWKWTEQIAVEEMQLIEALVLAELATPSALQLALELYDPSELESFRTFVVESELVSEQDLESAILGRLLVKEGRLRKASVKRIFRAMKEFGIAFVDALLVTIDISIDELMDLAKTRNLPSLEKSVAKRLPQSNLVAC